MFRIFDLRYHLCICVLQTAQHCSTASNLLHQLHPLYQLLSIKVQMDFGINSIVQSLLGEDGGQYCKSLFALGERVGNDRRDKNIEVTDINESDSEESVSKEYCILCSKTYQSPNNLAIEEIRRCKTILKVSGKGHYLRDNSITSLNLEDYLRPSIWCWHPQRLLPSTSKPLVCWNRSCAGHLGTISSPITIKEYDHRSVEDITTNGFIIFPVFLCSICKRTKSSLEMSDLAAMGIPPFVIRRCPVISFRKTTYTVELAELIMTLMTSELGAGQISTVIMKRRTAYWAATARVYLEAHTYNLTLDSEKGSLSSYGFTKAARVVQPFPTMNSHCNGFGGSNGPSSRNIQRFFIVAHTNIDPFADRFMLSLGGQVSSPNNLPDKSVCTHKYTFFKSKVLSADHTFNIPSRIKSSDIAGSSYSPIEGLHAGNLCILCIN